MILINVNKLLRFTYKPKASGKVMGINWTLTRKVLLEENYSGWKLYKYFFFLEKYNEHGRRIKGKHATLITNEEDVRAVAEEVIRLKGMPL